MWKIMLRRFAHPEPAVLPGTNEIVGELQFIEGEIDRGDLRLQAVGCLQGRADARHHGWVCDYQG